MNARLLVRWYAINTEKSNWDKKGYSLIVRDYTHFQHATNADSITQRNIQTLIHQSFVIYYFNQVESQTKKKLIYIVKIEYK